ncbi:type II toxin-antitoxin system HicB family antitoxin [Nitratidesulfovibrio vulgaris]|uniref:Transcriptional regulator, CopG family n=2 Tax=Nitratidesulfovibrio vulgaris TaxID=881 RepID=Q726B0_NITV2|nr:type II toxin-antitoxin system HicB family antitoxin [Nitratidesulfovibrio vulgaris]GEB78728.1 CopG family transcriptional regulator [Desulfovibrio desulfuricans]HBW15049.1 CopG family transcriptional regulator [Desulfovibrio sp.]AAS97725.1 transcriptional regulator, CopG family [Nitratidesulfovibrio vulgaris str. Hildenborough]ABM27158.1 protein of unknown function UPF0150 [Nitratidesulfovibrio vulgaris DP4]ADP88151.1 Uncharacterized protein family UPF0150 [Nitratidesulfovibrio vulgaris RC
MLYPALLSPEGEDAYTVVFPDFPDCEATADTLCEVYGLAEEVLAEHVRGLIGRGGTPPEPTTPDRVDGLGAPGVALLMVPVRLEPRRNVKVTLTISEDEKELLDRLAHEWDMSRSSLVVTALHDMCNRMGCD